MDVCETYGGLWDITFNFTKSKVAHFGFGNSSFCDIYLNGTTSNVTAAMPVGSMYNVDVSNWCQECSSMVFIY